MTYIEFESFFCEEQDARVDEHPIEDNRLAVLRRRIDCRAFWVQCGKELPEHLEFPTI